MMYDERAKAKGNRAPAGKLAVEVPDVKLADVNVRRGKMAL
jgi:hypothetical protein